MRIYSLTTIVVLAVTSSVSAETHTVLANNTSFSPSALEVAPGDTVIWQFNSGYPHTVTSGSHCVADVNDLLILIGVWGPCNA